MGRREGRSSQQQQQEQQKKKKMPSPLHNRQTDTLNSTSFLSSKFHSQISVSVAVSLSLLKIAVLSRPLLGSSKIISLTADSPWKSSKTVCLQSKKHYCNQLISLSLSPPAASATWILLCFFLSFFAHLLQLLLLLQQQLHHHHNSRPAQAHTLSSSLTATVQRSLLSRVAAAFQNTYIHTYVRIHTIDDIYGTYIRFSHTYAHYKHYKHSIQ